MAPREREDFLRTCEPETESELNVRGFEWRYLKHCIDQSYPKLTFEFESEPVCLRFSPAGKFVIANLADGSLAVIPGPSLQLSPKLLEAPSVAGRVRYQANSNRGAMFE